MSMLPEQCTEMDRYLFDLNGYIVLRGALSAEHVLACNHVLDGLQHVESGDWCGRVHGHNFTGAHEGVNLQQIYEAGPAFEQLIDHPAWIAKVTHFIGTDATNFDGLHGPCFIDENFANLRSAGEAIGLHSGGQDRVTRCQFRYHDGKFHCGQINILIGLNRIGPGDGATMVIPGSHKSNICHPEMQDAAIGTTPTSVDHVTGAVEVFLEAGDAILFVDAIMHGSAKRTNAGQRRIAVFRYGPSWGYFRHAYRPSDELLARLTPDRRQIVMPHESELLPP